MNSGFRERHSPISFNGKAFFPSQEQVLALAFCRGTIFVPLDRRALEHQKANFGDSEGTLGPVAALCQQGRWTPRFEYVSPHLAQTPQRVRQ